MIKTNPIRVTSNIGVNKNIEQFFYMFSTFLTVYKCDGHRARH